MEVEDPPLATLTHMDGYVRAEFVRTFDHPVADVWAALTEPSRLPQWLASGEIELRAGGSARLDFVDSGIVIDSVVSACEPQRLLEYSWSGEGEPRRPVRWSLDASGAGCRLTLTLGVPEGEDAARACAGWEAHLDMLTGALEGVPIKFPFGRFTAAREAYRRELAT